MVLFNNNGLAKSNRCFGAFEMGFGWLQPALGLPRYAGVAP